MRTDHGIIFDGENVRAILGGRKTQTRRLSDRWMKVKAGHALWVRETWRVQSAFDKLRPSEIAGTDEPVDFKVMGIGSHPRAISSWGRWRHAWYMPRWASRITLPVVKDARRERLQDISYDDCAAEGLQLQYFQSDECGYEMSARSRYAARWDGLHTKPGTRWEDNPMVTVLESRLDDGGRK